jgi:hypothetical protein
MSVDNFFIPVKSAAISSPAFFRFAISSLALFLCAFNCSVAVISSRLCASKTRNASRCSGVPRLFAISANTSK